MLEGEDGTLVMSGDVSLGANRAVVSADPPRLKADALVLESTYGGKLHAMRASEERRMIETLKAVTDRGGKVLIPAFALGRAQEVLQILLAFRDEFDVPVYADGMVRAVCNAYTRFPRLAAGEHGARRGRGSPVFPREDQADCQRHHARADRPQRGPSVVVASSGMLTGGASVVYASAWAGDERNGIFLTGYQDEEAPGRFLQTMMRKREAGQEFHAARWMGQRSACALRSGPIRFRPTPTKTNWSTMRRRWMPRRSCWCMAIPAHATAWRRRCASAVKRVQTPRIGQTISLCLCQTALGVGADQAAARKTRPLDTGGAVGRRSKTRPGASSARANWRRCGGAMPIVRPRWSRP